MEDGLCYYGLGIITAEDPEYYCQGGYCPVDISQLISRHFRIVHKLGHGGFATVWLARDERKNRYVALKIVAAEHSETYETLPKIASLRQSFPAFFLAELERFFIDSPNGRHLCQVFPVLGPNLASLTDFHCRLYPDIARDFARQITQAVEAMHSHGLCHGGECIRFMFPPEKEKIELRPGFETISKLRAPTYAVQAMNLTQLPSKYLSNQLCILDFDQTYSSQDTPRSILRISPRYLAPETIFEMRNGPPADVWALGCLIFRMRCGPDIFLQDIFESPDNTVFAMYTSLGGHLSEHWKKVPFDSYGWPASRDSLEVDDTYCDFSGDYNIRGPSLREDVETTFDVNGPQNVDDEDGAVKFRRYLPREAYELGRLRPEWAAKNAIPISREEADSFLALMLQVFEYDPEKRITASAMLAQPWFCRSRR
ncbi:kinase-like domain-containing protein [Xylaria arbuscula]|nr:kinase-like domain-containing protein [Xylaria arbuscula]